LKLIKKIKTNRKGGRQGRKKGGRNRLLSLINMKIEGMEHSKENDQCTMTLLREEFSVSH
jgi:hypothetical protein